MLLTQESDCKHTVPEVPDRFQALVDPSCLRQQEYLFFGVWGKLSSRAQEAWNWVVPHDSLPTRQTVQCRVWGCTSHQGGRGHQYLVGPLIKVPYWVLWIKPGLAISKARVLTLTPSLQIWEVSQLVTSPQRAEDVLVVSGRRDAGRSPVLGRSKWGWRVRKWGLVPESGEQDSMH